MNPTPAVVYVVRHPKAVTSSSHRRFSPSLLFPLRIGGINNLIANAYPLAAPFTPDDIDALFKLFHGDAVLSGTAARVGIVPAFRFLITGVSVHVGMG